MQLMLLAYLLRTIIFLRITWLLRFLAVSWLFGLQFDAMTLSISYNQHICTVNNYRTLARSKPSHTHLVLSLLGSYR